jgi:hypothetical protein
MTLAQLDRVQRNAMKIIVARCGYNRTTKSEIKYGSMAYGGANFRHLAVYAAGSGTIDIIHATLAKT